MSDITEIWLMSLVCGAVTVDVISLLVSLSYVLLGLKKMLVLLRYPSCNFEIKSDDCSVCLACGRVMKNDEARIFINVNSECLVCLPIIRWGNYGVINRKQSVYGVNLKSVAWQNKLNSIPSVFLKILLKLRPDKLCLYHSVQKTEIRHN